MVAVTFNIEWYTTKSVPVRQERAEDRQSAIDKVAASIAEFGWRQPIVVDAKASSPWGTSVGAANTAEAGEGPVTCQRFERRPRSGVSADDNRSNRGRDWTLICSGRSCRPEDERLRPGG